MNYIENVYICLAAPLLVAVFCSRGKARQLLLFLLSGMSVCLLSSYVSTFLESLEGMDPLTASLAVSPPVEEILKLCPFLFYLLVFEPGREKISGCVLMVALGFATLENVCYLALNGASDLLHLLIRGFGTGAMHVVCGAFIAGGMLLLWDRLWLRAAGTVGLLTIAITYHGIYNILVSQEGVPALIGYLIPVATAVAGWIFGRKRFAKKT